MALNENTIEMEERKRLLEKEEQESTGPWDSSTAEPSPQDRTNVSQVDNTIWDELVSALFCERREESEIITLVHQYRDCINPKLTDGVSQDPLLHMAVREKKHALVDTLLLPQFGMDTEMKSANGMTPLEIALDGWNTELDPIAARLVRATNNERIREMFASENRFQMLVEKNFTNTLQEVLDSLIDKNETGHTVFYDLLESEVTEESLVNQRAGNPILQRLLATSPYTFYQIFALNNCKDVVNSDVYRLFTIQKWKSFARRVLGFQILLFLISIVFLTYIAITAVKVENVLVYEGPVQQARLVLEIITLVFMVGTFVNEVAQLIRSKNKYFWDLYNIIELSSSILFILVLPLRFTDTRGHWYCFSIGFGIYMTGIFKYAIAFRSTGVHTQILWHIMKHDVIQFSMLFFVVNAAFAGGFYLMLQADNDILQNLEISTLPGILYVGVRTLVEGGPVIEYTGSSAFGAMSTLVLLIFLFMTVVILLNIFIAQINNTYQTIQDDAGQNYELNLAKYIAWIEINAFIFPCLKVCLGMHLNKKESIDIFDTSLKHKEPTHLENIALLLNNVMRKQTDSEGQLATLSHKLSSAMDSSTYNRTTGDHIKQTHRSARFLIERLESIKESQFQYERTVDYIKSKATGTDNLLKSILNHLTSGLADKSGDKPTYSSKMTQDLSTDEYSTKIVDTRKYGGDDEHIMSTRSFGRELIDPIRSIPIESVERIRKDGNFTDMRQEEMLGFLKTLEKETPGWLPNIFVGETGETVMHIAAQRGFYYVVEFLINCKVPIVNNLTTSDKQIPLQKALSKPYDDVAELIAKKMDKKELRSLFCRENSKTQPTLFLKDYIDNGCPKFLKVVFDAMIDCGEVFYNILESDSEGFAPNDLVFNDKTETVFQKIARIGNKQIVSHQVVSMLIEKKWKNFARGRFFFQMIMYLVSLATLTVSAVLGVMSDDARTYNTTIDGARAVFEVALYAYVTLMCLTNEIGKLYRKRAGYILSLDVLDGISVLFILSLLPVRYIDVRVHWYLFAIGYLLWALKIFRYAAIFRTMGAYAQTLWMIIKRDVVQFSALFIVVNLAFSGTYFLALKADNNLAQNSEISTFHGVFYAGLQTVTKGGPVIDYADGYGFFSTAVQMLFLFVTLVILLNLLIAQLSNTYTNIQTDAKRELQVRMARIIVSVEHGVMPFCRQTDVKNFYIPNEPIYEATQEQNLEKLDEIDYKVQHIYDKQVSDQLKMLDIDNEMRNVGDSTATIAKGIEEHSKYIANIHETFNRTNELSIEIASNWSTFSSKIESETVNVLRKYYSLHEMAEMIMRRLETQ